MILFGRRRRHREARLEEARAEHQLSRARLAHVREHIVEPLRRAGERNQFADMIRTSLMEGHGKQ